MRDPLLRGVAAVAALDEPTRRRLYEHVARQTTPVSRDEVTHSLHIPRATVAFHLDKLVDEGLLEVTYERRTGRSGPGAGRPAKHYRRSESDVTVSLPERHYDLAGRLLAHAVEESEQTHEPPRTVLERRAYQEGTQLAEHAKSLGEGGSTRDLLLRVLEDHGFEPRADGDDVVLGNCPFHMLVQTHADLVCGMNLHLLSGLLGALGDTGMCACLDPAPGRCCVRITGDQRCIEPGP